MIVSFFNNSLSKTSDDPKTKSEANCLVTYELENFEFLLSMVIWYDKLFAVNFVSKNLQNEDMHIDVVIDQLKGLISFFAKIRENSFTSTMISTKEITKEMKIKPIFGEKRVIWRRKQFNENVDDETILSVEEYFRIDYFLYIVDQTISSIKNSFEQFQLYENIFGFDLFLKSLDDGSLKKKHCLNLENVLKIGMLSDIDDLYFFPELKVLKEVLQDEINTPLEVLNYIKKCWFFSKCIHSLYNIINHTNNSCFYIKKCSKLKLIKS